MNTSFTTHKKEMVVANIHGFFSMRYKLDKQILQKSCWVQNITTRLNCLTNSTANEVMIYKLTNNQT